MLLLQTVFLPVLGCNGMWYPDIRIVDRKTFLHEVKMICWNVYMVACLYIAIVTSIHADCFTCLYADIIAVFHANMLSKWHICMFVDLYADMLSGKQAGMCSELFAYM